MTTIRYKWVIPFILALSAVGTLPVVYAQDAFMQIATQQGESDSLIEPPPPELPPKFLFHGPHDPTAVFTPADKLDTPEELSSALEQERQRINQFLKRHAPPLQNTRTITTLSKFQWREATLADLKDLSRLKAGSGSWKTVTIPHYGPPLGLTSTIYRTTFIAPQHKTNEVVILRFGAVDYRAHVFINNSYLGSHEGFFAPFEFDITTRLHPGKNVLIVVVENDFPTFGRVNDPRYPDLIGDKLYAATGPGYNDPIAGWHHCPPGMGILQPVTLEVRPAIHITDVFVRPIPEESKIAVLVEARARDTTPHQVEIQATVHGYNFDTGSAPVAQLTLTNLDPVGHSLNFYRFEITIPSFRWWTLDEPWLYSLQVQLKCPELKTSDAQEKIFGMRSFKLDTSGSPKGRFLFNGKEIKLRGANTMGFEQLRVMRGELDGLIDDFLLAKLCNMNYLRITQRPVQPEVYEIADRVGLLLQVDFPLFGHMRPNQFAEALKQMIEMERLIRSHPSCIMVSLINERFADTRSIGKQSRRMTKKEFDYFFAAAEQVIHFANPDRVIKFVEGDYDPPAPGLPDKHCYTLWYFRHGIDFGKLHKGYWQPVKPGWNYTCGEFGAEGLDRLELMRKYCPSEWIPQSVADETNWTPARIPMAQTDEMYIHFFDKPSTVQEWIESSRQHQALATKLMTEAFRRDNRMIGFAIHLFIDAWPTGWMKAIMDVDRVPKPAYFAYREALTPLMANIRTDRWKFFSGEIITCEFWVCNDTHHIPSNPIIKWQFELNNSIVHAQQAKASVEPVSATFQGYTQIPAPNVTNRTKATIRLALFDSNTLIHDTAVELEIFPRPQIPPTITVSVLEPSKGIARQILNELGVIPTDLSNASTILIDDYQAYLSNSNLLNHALANGARLIFLNLPPGNYFFPGSQKPTTIKSANPHFCSRKTGHPLVAGFEPFDFRFWYDEFEKMITPLANGKFSQDEWEPVLLAQDGLAVGMRKVNQGEIILCQLNLHGRTRANPPAFMFATRLLSPSLKNLYQQNTIVVTTNQLNSFP